VTGVTDDERVTSYGRQFAVQLQQMHPTRFVQERIGSDRIPVAEDAKESIAKFLNANPAFRLKQTPMLAYTASADFNDGGLGEKALAVVSTELLKIERVATLVPLLDYVGPLISASYDSARSIVHSHSARHADVVHAWAVNHSGASDACYACSINHRRDERNEEDDWGGSAAEPEGCSGHAGGVANNEGADASGSRRQAPNAD